MDLRTFRSEFAGDEPKHFDLTDWSDAESGQLIWMLLSEFAAEHPESFAGCGPVAASRTPHECAARSTLAEVKALDALLAECFAYWRAHPWRAERDDGGDQP
jgi:hypothetical protein